MVDLKTPKGHFETNWPCSTANLFLEGYAIWSQTCITIRCCYCMSILSKATVTLGPDSFKFLGKIGDCKTVLELKYFFKINLNPLCIARDLSINNFLSPESAKSTEKSRVLQPLLAQHLRKMLILRLKIGSFFYVWSLYIVRTYVGSFSCLRWVRQQKYV